MEIKLIHNKDCHIWQKAEEVLKEALAGSGLAPDYELVVVENDSEAEQYKFFGSPQITIDGVDIDPSTHSARSGQAPQQFKVEGCRIYMWQGKMYEYPPKEMIVEKLKAQSAK